MKQAGLITCHNIKNYGSIFQTYATSKIFERAGYQVTVLDYQRPGTDKDGFRAKIKAESRLAHKPILKWFFPKLLDLSLNNIYRVFDSFVERYIKLSASFDSNKGMQECGLPYDIYISGSDQIWNSSINGSIIGPYFLDFVPDSSIKISFASSFGKTKLDPYEIDETKRLLSRYDCITTREESGAKIVQDLGIKAKAILDPTMWLRKEDWEVLKEKVKTPSKYILVYQLHGNKEFDNYVRALEKKYKMPCLRIDLYYHYVIKAGRHVICPTPGQVISLIENAAYVVTDSFHMTVFSILFHKKFISLYSENSFSDRINNILLWLNLLDRHVDNYQDFNTLCDEINYDQIDKILTETRNGLWEWLMETIEQVEELHERREKTMD